MDTTCIKARAEYYEGLLCSKPEIVITKNDGVVYVDRNEVLKMEYNSIQLRLTIALTQRHKRTYILIDGRTGCMPIKELHKILSN